MNLEDTVFRYKEVMSRPPSILCLEEDQCILVETLARHFQARVKLFLAGSWDLATYIHMHISCSKVTLKHNPVVHSYFLFQSCFSIRFRKSWNLYCAIWCSHCNWWTWMLLSNHVVRGLIAVRCFDLQGSLSVTKQSENCFVTDEDARGPNVSLQFTPLLLIGRQHSCLV